MQVELVLAEVRYARINNEHQSAFILHSSSIATNNHQCFEKLFRETISFKTEDLSGHTEQPSMKSIGGATSGWGREVSPADKCVEIETKLVNESFIKTPIEP